MEIMTAKQSDLPAIVEFILRDSPNKSEVAGTVLEHARQVYFDNPWYDPELPSLVVMGRPGGISGFLGVTTRQMWFRDRPIRVAVTSNFLVRPERPDGSTSLAAAGLIRHLLKGPQDLTITDTANDNSKRIFEAVGAATPKAYFFDWFRPIRPSRAVLQLLNTMRNKQIPKAGLLNASARIVDLAGKPLLEKILKRPEPHFVHRPFDPGDVAAILHEQKLYYLTGDFRRANFDWLMPILKQKAGEGQLVARTVTRGSEAIGTFIYIMRSDGFAEVILTVAQAGAFDAVFASLIADAGDRGASLLTGNANPMHFQTYRYRGCLFLGGCWLIVQSPDQAVVDAFHAGSVLLTGLDGERWTRFGDLYGI